MSWKLASTVRRGTFGKVPLNGNSLGVYPTIMVWGVASASILPLRARVGLVNRGVITRFKNDWASILLTDAIFLER